MIRFTHTLRSVVSPWASLFLLTTPMTAAERPALMTWATFETEADVAKWKTLDAGFERAAEFANFVACSRGVPNAARLTYGFALWRMGYSCLIPWHYQAPVGNPFSDFDAHYGDWCMAYPDPDGPIPTQRWEAVREGIDDGRYLYTLEARIAEAKARGDKHDAVAAGEALLAEIRNAVPVQATYGQTGPWQGPEYTTYRRRLAAAILRFK